MWNPLAALGSTFTAKCAGIVHDALGVGEVFSRTSFAALDASRGALRALGRTTVMQVYFTGVQSVLVAGFLAVLVGAGFGQVASASGIYVVVPILRDVVVELLGPLLAALVVVARSAPAVAVELGNMKVGGELRMLESFGVDPFRHLALPRILGIGIGVTALAYIVTSIALLALFVMVRSHPEHGTVDFWLAVNPAQAVQVGLLGTTFGVSIALVAIHHGLALIPLFTEVPKAASRAVVHSLVVCAVIALVVAVAA